MNTERMYANMIMSSEIAVIMITFFVLIYIHAKLVQTESKTVYIRSVYTTYLQIINLCNISMHHAIHGRTRDVDPVTWF